METKRCSKCGEEKPISAFSYKIKAKNIYQSKCKPCVYEYNLVYSKRSEVITRNRERSQSDHYKKVAKEWEDIPEVRVRRRLQARNRTKGDKHKAWRKGYESQPEVREKINKFAREYRKTEKWKDWAYKRYWENDQYRVNACMRSAVSRCMNGEKNGKHWFDIVGYNLEELISHIEKQFVDGMNWKNYGEWEIDHIIPISVFNFISHKDIDFKRAWDLKNLQPLWKHDNRSKRAKIDRPFQPSMAFGGKL
jgi:hypothetical protein